MEHTDVNNLRANWLRIFHDLSGQEQIDAANNVFSDHSLREKSALVLCESFEKEVSFLEMVRLLSRLPTLRPEKQSIRKIGLVVRRLNNGGVERVVALLIPILQKAGFEVVLLTNESAKDTDYPVPDGILRIVLPESGKERMESLMVTIKTQSLDALFLHNCCNPEQILDMLTGKVCGIPSVMTWHNVFFVHLILAIRDYLPLMEATRFADKVIALSQTDEDFFRQFGASAEYVPNPQTFVPDKSAVPSTKPVILFPARMAEEKRPVDALKIFHEVRMANPMAKMLFAGKFDDPAIEKEVSELCETFAFGDSVEILGYCTNMDSVFSRTKVMLMTSSVEGFPMTILEAKSRGIPVVAYELPYVETMKPGSGVLSVPQKDVHRAAVELNRLQTDEPYYQEQSRSARTDAFRFAEYDLVAKYKMIFSPETFSGKPAGIDSQYQLWKVLLEGSSELIPAAFRKGMQDEREKITHGLTYRIGRIFTAIPLWIKRKIRPE